MTLYKKLKPHLGGYTSVISDEETLLLNRKDYQLSQVSPTFAMLQAFGVQCGYPFRVLIAFIDQFAANVKTKDFNVFLTDPSLTFVAFHVFVVSGGTDTRGTVYAPRGVARMPEKDGFAGELLRDFAKRTNRDPAGKPPTEEVDSFSFVIGNTKTPEQTIFAADRFAESAKGLLVLKDYAKLDAADEREYIESKGIYLSMTFEGHAFAIKNLS